MQLKVTNLSLTYGAIQALRNVSMQAQTGKVVVLVGANGAGKSSLIRCIMGLVPKSTGEIWLGERRIDEVSTHKLGSFGMAFVPEGRRLFGEMTVLENLLLGAHCVKSKKAIQNGLEEIWRLLPILQERRHQISGSLSGGEQQMLAIARALMAQPKTVLLDEPSLGLAPITVQHVAEFITGLNRERGLTLVMAEQNARMGLRISDYAYVLETGSVVLEGQGIDLLHNDYVTRAYLGGG